MFSSQGSFSLYSEIGRLLREAGQAAFSHLQHCVGAGAASNALLFSTVIIDKDKRCRRASTDDRGI
jgi:hypothetical protein